MSQIISPRATRIIPRASFNLRAIVSCFVATGETAVLALDRMEVDTFGLDEMDRKLLMTVIDKFDGGPVGLGTLSASIHEEKDSIEEIIEPYLIQIGFLNRTPRGRVCTRLAYEHFGLQPPRPTNAPGGLFNE